MSDQWILREACITSVAEAKRAEQGGADRLELCVALDQDGLSPDRDLLQAVIQAVQIPVKVMVRPRPGGFCYSLSEINAMIQTIRTFKELKPQGFVLGCLTPDGKLDVSAMHLLARESWPVPVTFHKAIDVCLDPLEALMVLKSIPGVKSVLTSGAAPTAKAGAALLRQMIEIGGEDLTIVAAGKINYQNLEEIHQLIGAKEYHGRRIIEGVV